MAAQPQVVLDLSRLVSRVLHPTPTGVDRVEMAYARGLLATIPERLYFGAVHPSGVYGRLPRDVALAFLDETERRWHSRGDESLVERRLRTAKTLWRLRPRPVPRGDGMPRLFVQPSPNTLGKPRLQAEILRRERARLVCLLHDLIPIEFPEYARPGGAAQHRARIDTMLAHAAGVIGNSAATLAALRPYLGSMERPPLTAVAHLGTDAAAVPPSALTLPARPYFVCIGTIEPRKNHLLLLNLWRRLAQIHGPRNVPLLIVIGRRGWENEQVVDMLERCPALEGCVREYGGLPDEAVKIWLSGARALLLPSFAEGYGMPVSEALTLGVPVVCSDLPALREAGGDVPLFLDPLDGPAWERAVDDLAGGTSAIAADQACRRQAWAPPTWPEHIAILLDMLHKLAP